MRTWTLPFEKPPAWLEKGSFAFEVKPANNKRVGKKEVCEKSYKNSEKSFKEHKIKTQDNKLTKH